MNFAFLLKRAYAIEIGAYNAYVGHARSFPRGSAEREKIREIQWQELEHKDSLGKMLTELGEKPNPALNFLFLLIGKSVSFACEYMPEELAAWGAKMMEKMGSATYWELAREATNSGHQQFHAKLCAMARQEQAHEEFFKTMNDPTQTVGSDQQS